MHWVACMNIDKAMAKIKNSKHVIFSLIFYFILTQLVHVVIPVKYLNEHLVSHTILFLLILTTTYCLGLFYSPQETKITDFNKFIYYCVCGLILCVLINFPYGIWLNKLLAKPKEYTLFLNYGPVARLYFLVMLCFVGPVLEEVYCRRYIYNMIKSDFGVSTGVIVSAFIYMVLHGLRIDFVHLFIPGIIYALVYEKTKSIWSSIVVHSFNNMIWFSLVYYV